MKNQPFKSRALLMLTSFITGIVLTGCTISPSSLRCAMLTGTTIPRTVLASETSKDTTAPVIDAMDIVIPYGTYLRPDEMASITDDKDDSPVLDISSVNMIEEYKGQETAAENTEASPAVTEETSAEVIAEDSTEVSAEPSSAEVIAEDTAEPATAEDVTEPGIAEDVTSEVEPDTTSVATNLTEANADPAAETEPAVDETAYFFDKPGKYSVELKGIDKSGNESTKTVTVTVIDNIAPVFDGLQDSFSITDKDIVILSSLDGITAMDEIDGDVTSSIKVDDSEVQYGNAGSYNIIYSASDASGNVATATTPVVITDTTAPTLTVTVPEFIIFVTDEKPNYAASVATIDKVDGNVKDTLVIDDSSVQYGTPGEYYAQARVSDRSGNTAEKSIKVIITSGWKLQDGKRYYYSLTDGHLYHSWSHIDDKLYYFDPDDGHMLTGPQTIDGRQYLFDASNGYMITGWQTIDGEKYYFSPDDGHMYHDWSHIGDKLYYFDPDDGHMLTGSQTINGRQYLLDSSDGHAITGWQTISGKKYYFASDDGHMYHDWSNINGKEFYFDPDDGHMLTGSQTINGRQYLLDSSDGHMITGWQKLSGNLYYFAPDDGHMYHDWSNIDGKEYYFDKSDGHMYTGKHTINGVEYDFGTTGVATKVVQQRSSSSSGTKSTSSTTYIGNKKTKKFHYADCSSVRKMNDSNKVYFGSREAAINAGYEPCKNCYP